MTSENLPDSKQLEGKTLLGIDYGTKVIGLAVHVHKRDPWPQPFGKIVFQTEQQVIEELKKVIEDNQIDILILGLPLYTDGNESDMTKTVRKFQEKLSKEIQLPLYLQDETLSSFEAEDRMKNSAQYNFKVDLKMIDAVAASIILEDFIKMLK